MKFSCPFESVPKNWSKKHGKKYLDDSIENSKQYYACPAEYVGRKTRASLS